MTEAASNALLFEQGIDERVVMALMRVLTSPVDMNGFATNLVYAFLQRPELHSLVEERCARYVDRMQLHWMNEGAKKYASSMHAEQPRYMPKEHFTRW